jgi:hypothetical protein
MNETMYRHVMPVITGVLSGTLAGLLAFGVMDLSSPPEPCVTVDVTPWFDWQDAPDIAGPLIEAGWYSDPADHAERLYSPGCR